MKTRHVIILDEGLEYTLNSKEKTASVRCEGNCKDFLEGEIFMPQTIRYKDKDYTVNYIPLMGFAGCDKITKVIIPPTIDRLLRSTFEYCSDLVYVEIPASVKIFLPNIFFGCKNLKRIVFENLKESNSNTEEFNLNEEVFNGCNPEVIIEDKATGNEFRIADILKL